MPSLSLSPPTQHTPPHSHKPLPLPRRPAVKTHRELFADFFASLFGYPLEDLIASKPGSEAAQRMHAAMQRDILGGGGHASCEEQVGLRVVDWCVWLDVGDAL